MEQDEKLPDCNPTMECPNCGNSYPMWRLHVYIGDNKKRLAHNFCPVNGAQSVCIDCKVKYNAIIRKTGGSSRGGF